ncbi:MAG: hypothetical protein GY865_17955, partial [candidate division Zixibacteria bacterium]|nr:hypothetical protein [candidate division Zixibacteria bacterium]
MKNIFIDHKSLIFVFLLIFAFTKYGFCDSDNAENNIGDDVVIDSIIIENGDIFDLNLPENENWIFKLANKLHVNTKKHVIMRELLFKEGDLFSEELANESGRNLRSLPYLFNAQIETTVTDSGRNVVKVTTSDRWTLAGGPTISRNSGQTTYQLGFEEVNFLGYGQRVSFDYFIREFEENYFQASFYERRLFGSRYGLNFYHNGHPEIGDRGFSIIKPLFSLDSKFAYSVSYNDIDRLDKYYSSGSEFAQNRYRSKHLGFSTVYRFGDYHNKVSIGFTYNYKDIDISDRLIIPSYSFSFPIDSV